MIRKPRFSGLRRRMEFDRRSERLIGNYGGERGLGREEEVLRSSGGGLEKYGGVLAEKPSNGKQFDGVGGGRLKVRWQLAFLIAVS